MPAELAPGATLAEALGGARVPWQRPKFKPKSKQAPVIIGERKVRPKPPKPPRLSAGTAGGGGDDDDDAPPPEVRRGALRFSPLPLAWSEQTVPPVDRYWDC